MSIKTQRVAPASVIKLATSLAAIDSRPAVLRAPNKARNHRRDERHDARLHASIMTKSSIKLSFVGGHVGCTRKTSEPRMDSLI